MTSFTVKVGGTAAINDAVNAKPFVHMHGDVTREALAARTMLPESAVYA